MGSHRRTIAAAVAVILASVSLYPIFIGTQWFWAGTGAVLAVALAGTLTRLRRLPFIVCVIGEVAGLTLFLNLAFESARSEYGLVPTPTSLGRLWDLAGTGFHESAKYAPPVPGLSGMVLLAAAGIGLTAILTDLIAVRLENAALAGLPLLLLFTEPFTLSVSRGAIGTTIAFCLGTGGYLALLSSEGKDHIREWERPDPGPNEVPDTRALAITGRRVGIAAVAVALFLPVFVPGLHATRLFGGGQPGIGGTGGVASAGFPSPDTQLSNELHQSRPTQVLTYTSSDANPGYLQIYVLDNLTDSGFRMFGEPESLVSAATGLPAPPGLTISEGSATETTQVSVSPATPQDVLGALPVPYPATRVLAPGTLQADKNTLMVFENGVQLGGLHYTVHSLDQSPSAAALNQVPPTRSGVAGVYLGFPQSYDALRRIADAQVAKAGAVTPFEKAVAIQNWLTGGGFRYTLLAPTVTDEQSLANFLTTTKKGYCQQFSFAMAVLARLLGIPSRLAYGFTSGSPGQFGNWRVTTHDAHSWPELYFQGFGWLRFEPTPQGLRGQGTAYSPAYTQATGNLGRSNPGALTPTPEPTASTGLGSAASNGLENKLRQQFGVDSGGLGGGGASDKLTAWDVFLYSMLALLCLFVLVAVTPALARGLIRRGRWRRGERGGDAGLAHAAWRELRDDLVDYRAGYQPSESPRALAARVGESLELSGPAMAALRRVAMAEERARYARRPDGGAGLRHDSAVVRRAIVTAATRRTRVLARLVPSSVIGPAMIRVAQAADFTGRLDPEEWFGRTGLGWRRSGRARSATAGLAGGEAATKRSEPPVPAGSRDR
jgi:transglutaminase-like putative cysteine protease